MASEAVPIAPRRSWLAALNTRHHQAALNVFMLIVVAHWAEHIVQAFQVWVLGWPRPQARGVLGEPFPWLIKSEWLHYGYAIVMLVALWTLRHGFVGRARRWWNLALGLQFWHHIEHLLLLIQAMTGVYFFGGKVPTSVLQYFFPRMELHLFYNTVVTIPMLVAVYLHLRPTKAELLAMTCSCAEHRKLAMAA